MEIAWNRMMRLQTPQPWSQVGGFSIFGQLYLALGVNPTSQSLARVFFGK